MQKSKNQFRSFSSCSLVSPDEAELRLETLDELRSLGVRILDRLRLIKDDPVPVLVLEETFMEQDSPLNVIRR